MGESGQSGTMSRPQDVIFKHCISTLIFHFSTPPTIQFQGPDLCSTFLGLCEILVFFDPISYIIASKRDKPPLTPRALSWQPFGVERQMSPFWKLEI